MHLWQLDVENMGAFLWGFFSTKNKSARAQGRFPRERRFYWGACSPITIYYHLDATTALGAGGIPARLDEIQNSQAATRAIVDENRAMLRETRAMTRMMNIRLAAQNAKVPQERDHYNLQTTAEKP
jgi:hypothetical protein